MACVLHVSHNGYIREDISNVTAQEFGSFYFSCVGWESIVISSDVLIARCDELCIALRVRSFRIARDKGMQRIVGPLVWKRFCEYGGSAETVPVGVHLFGWRKIKGYRDKQDKG